MSRNAQIYSVIIAAAVISLMLIGITSTYAQNVQNGKFRAKLDANNEIPPVNSTAEGVINFKTKDDILTWKMNVSGITDATGLRIYQGMKTENGQAIVDLLKSSKHSDRVDGMQMRGNITESDFIGTMQGKTLEDLKTLLGSENTYVNVQTEDHPDGMIRGQVKLKGTDDSSTASMNMTSSSNAQ
jgi:hypothetical protein